MKTTVRKLLSLILSFAVTAGILCVAQGTVLAHGSEGEKDFCYLAMDCDGATPAGFPEDGYIYYYSPWGDGEICQSWDGASYDVVTNTLTLNNFNHPNVGLIIDGMDEGNCGSEFKIVLIGDNHIQRIDDGFSGLFVQGSGTLTINENKKAQGGVVTYHKGWESDSGNPQFHIGEDATVTIYKSPDTVSDYGDVYKSYCIAISDYDKETETADDYLVYDGKVTPEIEWECEEVSPASFDYEYLSDKLYVKTDFATSRLFADNEDPNAIRLLVEGQVTDFNETYAWLEKHNGKWYVSRSSWYDDGISGQYTGTLPDDLKNGDDKITAYMLASSPISSEIYMPSSFLYTKDNKYYAVFPICMLVDEWVYDDAPSSIFCLGEVVNDTPAFELHGEYVDSWIMDSFTEVRGVSNGTEADEYMTENGYEKVIARSYSASYELRTVNESITFSPDKTENPVSGWVQEDGKWYYYDDNGTKVTGWKSISGTWYYFDTSGAMCTGWKSDGGTWYYFSESGAMISGWKDIGGKWYYFESSGAMATGWKSSGNKWYYFDTSGAMVSGWKTIGGKWYYFNGGGDMVTGWKQLSGKWYYFNGGGDMATGWQLLGGKWYYFNGGGDMATGWKSIGGSWYYFNGGGDMVTGWKQIGGKWYYFYGGGAMAYNTTIDGCKLDSSGAWIN